MFNHLTLESNDNKRIILMGQRVAHRDDTHYYFQLFAEQETLIGIKQSTSSYKIIFHENRSTFQSQHLALDYMLEHNLIDCLVNNDLYEENIAEKPFDLESYCFRYIFCNIQQLFTFK